MLTTPGFYRRLNQAVRVEALSPASDPRRRRRARTFFILQLWTVFLRDDRVQIRCLGFRIRERSAPNSVDEDNSRETGVWR